MSSIVKAAITTVSENLGGVAHRAALSHQKFDLDDVPDLSGKVGVITGGSQGIGYGCTYTLLSKNISKLFVISMSREVVDEAIKVLKEQLGEEKAERAKWIQCDLSDWNHVANVATEIKDATNRLDILINNASRGIMTHQLTDYGIERHMAVNHLGHVILTSHLLPLLKKTAGNGDIVRIANQASNAHESAPKDTRFESVEELNKDLGPLAQYGRSKLANILYSRYLARHLTRQHPNILVNATHPGIVETKQSSQDIHEPYPRAGYLMSVGLKPFKKDQFDGAASLLFASTATTESGQYVCPPAAVESGSELAQDEQLGERLMKLTRDVITQKTSSQSTEKGCPMKDY